ncbi:siderophore-interacting protein [Ancylobacter oerskovii]|uniref:DUF2218 domain-containing protein n=1 Tax=Ancylobacter oerskovii TaxID=459519 RepID=A0ABW4YWI5_9HYPH|nr:siderophore-interacting protein [Ancylobacter oerskovii]MBS7544196.1 siderophore-interacting protein [Ancylobacter oerskovii]
MNAFAAQARLTLCEPEKIIARLCEHMIEHDARVESSAEATVLHYAGSSARFSREGSATLVDVSAPNLESLHFVRMAVASHVLEFAGSPAPVIRWSGDGTGLDHPPNFRILQVIGARNLTPHMRRLTFSGADVGRFAPLDALHVNLLMQHPDLAEPQWPRLGADGLIAWADPQRRPVNRKYTVRSVDVAAGTLDIDFVLHEAAGPGSAFARDARIGDRIGVIGPGGGGLSPADWYLFAGDETALPAIARMLEHLPAQARGRALIEVADASEVQPLACAAAIEVEWLCRDGVPAGTSRRLVDAVQGTPIPQDGSRIHVWAGCEFAAFTAIRGHLRRERNLGKHEHLVVSYWRRGRRDGE